MSFSEDTQRSDTTRQCVDCGASLPSQKIKDAVLRRGGEKTQALATSPDLCPQCKRRRLAAELAQEAKGQALGS